MNYAMIAFDSGKKVRVKEEARDVADDMENTPEDTKIFEYELPSGEKTFLKREKMLGVKELKQDD